MALVPADKIEFIDPNERRRLVEIQQFGRELQDAEYAHLAGVCAPGAKVTVLIESVRHHVKEEEQDLFPKVTKKIDKRGLEALGKAMETAKKIVPSRPHPRAPDTPPGNVIAGLGASMLDKAKDLVQGVAKRGLSGRGTNGAAKKNGATGRAAKKPAGARSRATNGASARA